MRIKSLLFVLSVVSVFIGILLFQKDPVPLKIITSPNIYSYMKSTDVEPVKLSMLINQLDTYYTEQEYVSNIEVFNDSTTIPLTIKNIYQYPEEIIIENQSYYQVDFYVEIGFQSDDYLISIEDAFLHVTYINQEEFSVNIGEFHYIFNESINTDISLGNYMATVFDYDNKRTVSGISLELNNTSSSNIIIKEIQLLSESVSLNNDYSISLQRELDMFESVEDVLLQEFDTEDSYQMDDSNHVLRVNNSISIYVPINYHGEIKYLHRACIKVVYEIDGETNEMIIDDFPFISTSIFQPEYQNDFILYEY